MIFIYLFFMIMLPFSALYNAFNGFKTLKKPAEERTQDETYDAWSAIIVVVFTLVVMIWLYSLE